MAKSDFLFEATKPMILRVPGLNDGGPGHWHSCWERGLQDLAKVDPQLRRFAPFVDSRLPSDTTLLATRNDPYATSSQRPVSVLGWGLVLALGAAAWLPLIAFFALIR